MKHPQHILAFDKAAFGDIPTGIVPMSESEFYECAERSLIIGRRHELEADERFGQCLPYIVIRGTGGSLFLYQRGKGVGEARLAGNYSIGLGGHVDLADVVGTSSIISVRDTFMNAMLRELREEVGFTDNISGSWLTFAQLAKSFSTKPKFAGIINDTSDAVGRVHYGMLYVIDIPHAWRPRCMEDELSSIGLVLPELMSGFDSTMENWSRLAIDHFKVAA